MHDTLGDGRAIRILTLVDDFTRTCPLIAVDLALPAARVARELDPLAATTGLPGAIVCENGTEFTSRRSINGRVRVASRCTLAAGKPVENAYAEKP